MKKIIIIITACILLASCSPSNVTQPTDAVTPTNPSSEIVTSEQSSAPAIPEIEPLDIRKVDKIISPAKEIKANELRYTHNLGKRKSFENALPQIVLLEYPNLYYSVMNIGQGGIDTGSLDIGRYSIEGSKKEILGNVDFQAQSNVNDAICLIDSKYLIYTLCRSDKEGILTMDVVKFDCDKKTKEVVYSHPVGNVFTYVKQVNKDEFVVSFYAQEDPMVRDLTQIIAKYNIETKDMKTIYEGEIMKWDAPTTTRDVWAMDTYGGDIYLLKHQLVDGTMKTFLTVMDADGKSLSETELAVLRRYNSKDQTVTTIVVEGEYIFLNYFESGSNPPFVILKRDNDVYNLQKLDTVYPNELAIPSPVDNRYLCFSTYPKDWQIGTDKTRDADLFIFDLQSGTAHTIKTDIENIGTIIGDSSGNILITNQTEYISDKLYLFNKDDIFC